MIPSEWILPQGALEPLWRKWGARGSGFVCHLPDQTASKVCIPNARPGSMEGECSNFGLEAGANVCFLSVGDNGAASTWVSS